MHNPVTYVVLFPSEEVRFFYLLNLSWDGFYLFVATHAQKMAFLNEMAHVYGA